jgi:SPX domain protein involved in polyphosphate accumulation
MPELPRKYRFEIKYRVGPEHAQTVRDWIHRSGHLTADANGEGGSAAYNVHSLYLDNAEWAIYKETRAGLQQRHKLRARCYEWSSRARVFLEAKHRASE